MKKARSQEEIERELLLELISNVFWSSYSKLNKESYKKSDIYPLFFKNLPKLHTTLNPIRKCCFKYCRKNAVGSHLFQEAILKSYSKKGFLLTPDVNTKRRNIYLKSIAVSNALKFSGFCFKHEDYFTYEKKRKLEYVQDLRLLVFKSLCYDYVITEEAIKNFQSILKGMTNIRNEKMIKNFKADFDKLFSHHKINITTVQTPDNEIEKNIKKYITEKKERLSEINKFRQWIYSDWKKGKNGRSENIKSFALTLPPIPVFLSYYGNFTMKTKDGFEISEVLTSIIVHPFDNMTLIVLSCHRNDYSHLKKLITYLIDDVNKGFRFITLAMTFVSDNWLINEDFYNSEIPTTLKELIENAKKLPLNPHFI